MSSRLNSHRKKFGPVTPTGEIQFSGVTDSAVRNALCLISYQLVELWKKDGTVLRGHFGGIESVSGKLHVVLRYASIKSGDPYALSSATERRGNVAERVRIPVSDFTKMETLYNAMEQSPNSKNHALGRNRPDSRTFATDGQIANRLSSGPGRELKKFDDFSEFPTVSSTPSSNVYRNGNRDTETFGEVRSAGKWDQFRTNQEKFGVHTTFDESEYTTKIDRSSADFRAREREAARIAAEIESKSSSNIHMQEERNQRMPADLDEETLYSGVQRPKSFDAVHMSFRNKAVQNGSSYTASHSMKTNSKDQNVSFGPSKHDVRPKNGGLAKIPQKSAIPSKAVWGSKNNQTKGTAPFSKLNQAPKNLNKAGSVKSTGESPKSESLNPNPPTQPIAKTSAAMPKTTTPNTKATATVSKGPLSAPQSIAPVASVPKPATVSKSKQATKKLSYAAAAGARVSRQQPASPILADFTAGPRPPRSPISPNKPNTVKSGTGGIAGTSRSTAPRNQNAGRLPNGGRTPPVAARNSPNVTRSAPSNPETSAMDALNLEPRSPKIVKSFEQFKQDKVGKSLTEKRQEITNDFKKFSTDLDAKRSGPRKNSSGTSISSTKSEKQVALVVSATMKENDMGSSESQSTADSQSTDASPKQAATKEVSESKPVEKKELVSGATPPTRFKPVKKLNPNAASWQPASGPSSTPGVTTSQSSISHSNTPPSTQMQQPMPVSGTHGMDPYFHMNNFGGVAPNVSPGMLPEHQSPGYGFQMGPVGHPSNIPYAGYPSMMVPPGMPQNPAAFPYMTGARTPYIMPTNGSRFPPGAPGGIPVSIMPGNGPFPPGAPGGMGFGYRYQ